MKLSSTLILLGCCAGILGCSSLSSHHNRQTEASACPLPPPSEELRANSAILERKLGPLGIQAAVVSETDGVHSFMLLAERNPIDGEIWMGAQGRLLSLKDGAARNLDGFNADAFSAVWAEESQAENGSADPAEGRRIELWRIHGAQDPLRVEVLSQRASRVRDPACCPESSCLVVEERLRVNGRLLPRPRLRLTGEQSERLYAAEIPLQDGFRWLRFRRLPLQTPSP